MTEEKKEDRLSELEIKFEKLLVATNDVDLISAYALFKQEIHNKMNGIEKRLDAVIGKVPSIIRS